MGFSDAQFSLNLVTGLQLEQKRKEYRDVIIDRKSKYTVVALRVFELSEIKQKFSELKQEAYFLKASHNSYAYRIKSDTGGIIEGKNDDGEKGAGMCILRELRRENTVGIMLIVTRYFGGISLHADRFKNVINSCKIFFEEEKKKS